MNAEGTKILLKSLLSGKQFFAQMVIPADNDNVEHDPMHQKVIIALDDDLFRRISGNGLNSIQSSERLEHELRLIGVKSSLRPAEEVFVNTPEMRREFPKKAKTFLEMSSDNLIAAYRRNGLTKEAHNLSDFIDGLAIQIEKGRDTVVGQFAEYIEEKGLKDEYPELLDRGNWAVEAAVRTRRAGQIGM